MKVLMKTPSNCPFCGDPLLNEFVTTVEGGYFINKTCNKKLDHKITIRACTKNDDYVDFIFMPYTKNANVIWYMGPGHLIINSSDGTDLQLPFFVPNLSNYKNLIEKIQIYVLFS
jgi:hypothetical protein